MRQYLEYVPEYLREFREYQGLALAIDSELQKLNDDIMRNYQNQFVDTMDLATIIRWERILSLPARGDIEERRFAIAARRIRFTLFTESALRGILTELCGEDGFSLEVIRKQHLLRVRIALESQNNYDVVHDLLLELKPATMLLDLALMYNQHRTLAIFTHKQLSRYTHKELREKRFRFNSHKDLSTYTHQELSDFKHFQLMMEDLSDGQ